MFNNLFRARQIANIDSKYRCTALSTRAPLAARSVLATLRHALMIMGISAMCTLAVMFVKPDIADQLLAFSPYADKPSVEQKAELAQLSALVQAPEAQAIEPEAEELSAESKMLLGSQPQQKRVTEWLAKRYRVANDAANMLVSAAYLSALETKLDPLLILSVMAVESRFNPFAESPVGAQGLMQVMSKVHKEKFEDHGGVKAALNPVANIKVGSQILKEYVRRGGSVEAGLKSYVGAALHDNDGGYGAKVLSEYRKMKEVASGKRVPTSVPTVPLQVKRTTADKIDAEPTASVATEQKEKIAAAVEDKVAKL